MTLVLFGSVLVLLAVGAPIATAMAGSGLITILLSGLFNPENAINPVQAVQSFFSSIDSVALLAIPFFILAGDLMNKGGLAKRLVNFAGMFVGRITGGLGMTAVLSCMLFAAISGSGIATAAAIGGVMLAGFKDHSYPKSYATAIVASASPVGIIIPPSIAFILYGTLSKASVGSLYKVGFPSGLLIIIALLVTTYLTAKSTRFPGLLEISGTNQSKKLSSTRL
jgi:C4-dicarboxylate transporter DctM subunit